MKHLVKIYILCMLLTPVLQGCDKILEEENIAQIQSDNLLSDINGIESVLADSYAQIGKANSIRDLTKREEMTADELWQTGGGENGTAVSLINFFWDSNNDLEAFDWQNYWNAIRDVNTILDNVEDVQSIEDGQKEELIAEARFLRIWAYYFLWNQYGAMPIRTSLEDPRELARASVEEFNEFMESELLDVIPNLPSPGNERNYGRVNKCGAQALLCKWYLNNHKWEKSAEVAKDIIDSGFFELVPSYFDLFKLENEQNSEFILVNALKANDGNGYNLLATNLPPDYLEGIDGGMQGFVNTSWSNFASQYRLYDEFYYSFEEGDARRDRILTRYINSKGEEVNLLDQKDNTRAMKFPPDPSAQGTFHGNDFPFIRFADILLSRSEALNEMNGPNQESIDLINKIRIRANLKGLELSEFADKESLRDHILDERRWEFWYEGKRRRDLLRMGKYISNAQERGKNATEKHKLFPIPQEEVDANTLLEQNPGY